MRPKRLKLDERSEEAYYHCISRTAGSEWLLEDREKEIFRKQLWLIAEYCGIQVLTYAIMSNHYHILVRVPKRYEVVDEELVRLYAALYPKKERWLEMIRLDLRRDGEMARKWRVARLRQMFDISEFNKLLKMRFSWWYNKDHGRKGTLWESRFTSVLVEQGDALQKVAGYIDANPVKAGIVKDPKDYRFCGYAEAAAGRQRAREGLQLVHGVSWVECELRHRGFVLGSAHRKAHFSVAELYRLLEQKGTLAFQDVLQYKIRYFVQGLALGSDEYVKRISYNLMGPRPIRGYRKPKPLVPITNWTNLCVLSPMRSRLFG